LSPTCPPPPCRGEPRPRAASRRPQPHQAHVSARNAQRQQAEQRTAHAGLTKRAFGPFLCSFSSHFPSSDCQEKLPSFLAAATALPERFTLLVSQMLLQHVVLYIIFTSESLRFSPGMRQFEYRLHQVKLSGIFQPLRPYLYLYPWVSLGATGQENMYKSKISMVTTCTSYNSRK